MGSRRVLGTLAALLGLGGAAPVPAAQLPPVAIVHELRPRQVVTRKMREVPKASKAVAAANRRRDKRDAKHAYRAARRAGKPIGWREAHRRAGFYAYLMGGGTRAQWANVHARVQGAL